MKKIKVFLALIFSLACMFSLTACGGNAGYYVEDSLNADINYYSYSNDVSAMVEFQVYIPNKGKHEVSYTLTMTYDGYAIKSEKFTSTCTSDGKENVKISKYWSFDYSATNPYTYLFEVRLSNVKVSKGMSIDSAYVGLAIGFGIVGGLITVGLVALYVCLKKKKDNEQAA